jgi:IS1 family transposase
MNVLSDAVRVMIIMFLIEGMSIRAIERMTQVNRETIMSLLLQVGEGCVRLHNQLVRDLHNTRIIQLDEQWSFIFKKQKRVKDGDPSDFGDMWLFLALDADSRLVISFLSGKRTEQNTQALVQDVRDRVPGHVQISTDGYKPYMVAVQNAFGSEADYAMLTKQEAQVLASQEGHLRRNP